MVRTIGVGIPAFNAENYLENAVASVRMQTHHNWRMAIVDDGSTDDTATIARGLAALDPRIESFSQKNGGAAAARNSAMRMLLGACDFALFLDSDDILEPDAFATLLKALGSAPNAVAAHGIARHIDQKGSRILPGVCEAWCQGRQRVVNGRLTSVHLTEPTTFEVLAWGQCVPSTGAVLIRSDALRRVGDWDAATTPAEDYDMWLRLSLLGDIQYVDQVILNYRLHDNNISANAAVMHRAYVRTKKKMAGMPNMDRRRRSILRETYRYSQRVWAVNNLGYTWSAVKRCKWRAAMNLAGRTAKNCVEFIVGL